MFKTFTELMVNESNMQGSQYNNDDKYRNFNSLRKYP